MVADEYYVSLRLELYGARDKERCVRSLRCRIASRLKNKEGRVKVKVSAVVVVEAVVWRFVFCPPFSPTTNLCVHNN